MIEIASEIIKAATEKGLMVAAAESCTGGLISASLTDVPGSSAVVDRGFVTYTNDAKVEMLGVPLGSIESQGAVSDIVVRAMVAGALENSRADVAVAVTGIAGPTGGTEAKPVGLVYIASQTRDGLASVQEIFFGNELTTLTRENVRNASVLVALKMLKSEIDQATPSEL
jgi:nicotinamide-nucleotide amidase